MPIVLTSLLTAGLETMLNRVLYRDLALKTARHRLAGKVLSVRLQEFSRPLTLVFNEQRLDVLSEWQDRSDCMLTTRLSVLPDLRNHQRLAALIRSGDLDVDGDLQVVQHFSILLDLAELDPAEYLAPWTGDITAYGISQAARRVLNSFHRWVENDRHYLTEALTEEWRLMPGRLEIAWLCEEVNAIDNSSDALAARIARLEVK